MKISKQEVSLVDYMGSDLSVVNAARVSFSKMHEEFEEGKDDKLIAYLAKHNHWSPFAHTSLQFRIKAPIFVARQLVKHQVGGVWNEVSRRYVDDEPEFYFPDVWRGRATNAKQGSSSERAEGMYTEDEDFLGTAPSYDTWVKEVYLPDTLKMYNACLAQGVAPEQARMLLPQNTMTEWYWTGSLAFFARVCKLRLDAHAQKETQEVAQMINDCIPDEYQHSWKALMA